jgi:dihydropteroate synthase
MGKPPLIMGILNVTPDSFSDGGQFMDTQQAVDHGLRLAGEGADILDIGGESTRPNATPVTTDEEQKRILPVITALKKHNIKISVDTRNAGTMRMAIDAGADIINDVSALTHDANSLPTVAASSAQIVLMHMRGTPQTMQHAPHYQNVLQEVYDYLEARIAACVIAGIKKDRLIVDPGIGFGKTPEHNVTLLSNARIFRKLGVPVMIGASRKSFISALTGAAAHDRLSGSLAAAIMAYQQGAHIIRVHDVKETRQALMFWQALGDIDKPA